MTPSPNPHLEEIDNALINLKPGARTALMTGLASAGMQPQAQPEIPGAIPVPEPKQQQMDPGMVGVTQEQAQVPGAIPIPPSHVGLPPGVSDRMAIPQIGPVTPPKSPAMTEYERITAPGLQGDLAHTKADTGRSGIGQIHNPWARIPLQIADAVGSTFFPGISMALPGTELHHRTLVNDASNVFSNEQERMDNEAKRGLQEAEATNYASFPASREAKHALDMSEAERRRLEGQAKDALGRQESERKAAADKARTDSSLHQHGYKQDAEGNVVPLAYEEMSQEQQAVHDLKSSQSELASANAELAAARAKHLPDQEKMAMARIATAQKNAQTAAARLGLSEKTYEARYHGTEGDAPLQGAMVSEDGSPVGASFSANVRPTGQQRNKADLATSALDKLEEIKGIVATRPDIFGPAAGRTTDLQVWLGSQDPDAQRFRAARTIAGDHLAGVFGGRSETALRDLDAAIGHFKDNPKAIDAGLDTIIQTTKPFIHKGTVKTVGGGGAHPSTPSAGGSSSSIDDLVKKYGGKK